MVDAGWVEVAFVAGLLVQMFIGRKIVGEYTKTMNVLRQTIDDLKRYRQTDQDIIAAWKRSSDWWRDRYAQDLGGVVIGPDEPTQQRLH